ncbi:hypothetical protein C815_00252 [Firmicutes bacterium M10-2]|nr:hypothetical protein C815_00252 [Firmicutes bacterium M10-2]
MYQWINGNSYLCQVTFYPTNITLNSACCAYFENIRYVRVGLDIEHKKVAIEPISKQMIDLGLIPKEQLQKLSLGKGYGRISNKVVMHQIYTVMHTDVDGHKYSASFDKENNYLEIDCSHEV